MNICNFDIHGQTKMRCSACGRVIEKTSSTVVAECRGKKSDPPGLGDRVAIALDAIGITKARVEAAVGGPCGCSGRQAAMNAAGAKWLGMSPGSTAPPEIDPPTP